MQNSSFIPQTSISQPLPRQSTRRVLLCIVPTDQNHHHLTSNLVGIGLCFRTHLRQIRRRIHRTCPCSDPSVASRRPRSESFTRKHPHQRQPLKNDEFCIQTQELYTKNEGFCIKNDEECDGLFRVGAPRPCTVGNWIWYEAQLNQWRHSNREEELIREDRVVICLACGVRLHVLSIISFSVENHRFSAEQFF